MPFLYCRGFVVFGVCALLVCLALNQSSSSAYAESKRGVKIVLVAGTPSHGPGEHEFNAGVEILASCLRGLRGVEPVVVHNGWPAVESAFDGAASLALVLDGGHND